MMEPSVFVFSIATNNYDTIFSDYIESHRKYSSKYGYKYKLFHGAPPGGISGSDSAWLKIPLILKALNAGFDWVLFLDSDCMVLSNAPDIRSVDQSGAQFYMALDGRANIPNTGVMALKNSGQVRRFFRKLLILSDIPGFLIPESYRGLYEMGHIVFFSRKKTWLRIIDKKWNDNTNQIESHYILHAHGTFHKKKRSKEQEISVLKGFFYKFQSGLRLFRLTRYANWFWRNQIES